MSPDPSFWAFIVVIAVCVFAAIAVVACADNQPRKDDEEREDAEQEPGEMRLAA